MALFCDLCVLCGQIEMELVDELINADSNAAMGSRMKENRA